MIEQAGKMKTSAAEAVSEMEKDVEDKGGVFEGFTAWMSSSVKPRLVNLWVDGSGRLDSWDSADFLFSDDPAAPDTASVFNRREFVREGLAVFESSYIADCAQAGDIRKVPLGRYFLPSMKLQQEMKSSRLWRPFKNLKDGQLGRSSEAVEEPKQRKQSAAAGRFAEYVSIEELEQTTAAIRDVSLGEGGLRATKVKG